VVLKSPVHYIEKMETVLNSFPLKSVLFVDWIGQELPTHFVHVLIGFASDRFTRLGCQSA